MTNEPIEGYGLRETVLFGRAGVLGRRMLFETETPERGVGGNLADMNESIYHPLILVPIFDG